MISINSLKQWLEMFEVEYASGRTLNGNRKRFKVTICDGQLRYVVGVYNEDGRAQTTNGWTEAADAVKNYNKL
jgi:hypothetical protein